METSFFSGSENLYKYLVTMGILLIVLTVYYPLKEKQQLEIIRIQLENEVSSLNFKINENAKNLKSLKKDGVSNDKNDLLKEIEALNVENNINQIAAENKYAEILIRRKYITLYKIIFWIFFPIGIFLTTFGFVKWKNAKKDEDKRLKLENEKLEIEVEKLRKHE
ncbi:MAG: hypothetical protein KDE33_08830 [Bacteroidetes bacterium]|nr:hypothetical protein [Bacteroidota bacterium]